LPLRSVQRMSNINRGNKSGMTLIEVLVASGILAVCLSGLLLAYINLITLTDVTRSFTLANNAAQHIMELIKTKPFAAITNDPLTNAELEAILTNSEFDTTSAWARVTVVDTSAFLKKVTVMVFFRLRRRAMWQDTDEDLIPDLDEYSPVEIVNYIGDYTTGGYTP
jgi:prepilin-type N-terminal cleavage/methylation domain-containing protein